MNRNTADRIIVTSNARMERVLDWYFDNFKWLDREKFLAPMESGVVSRLPMSSRKRTQPSGSKMTLHRCGSANV